MKKVYIGNLARQTTDMDIKSAFASFGEVRNVVLILDRAGKSRGFGFIEMENDDQAVAAIAGVNGKELHGQPLKVNEASPEKPRFTAPRTRSPASEARRW